MVEALLWASAGFSLLSFCVLAALLVWALWDTRKNSPSRKYAEAWSQIGEGFSDGVKRARVVECSRGRDVAIKKLRRELRKARRERVAWRECANIQGEHLSGRLRELSDARRELAELKSVRDWTEGHAIRAFDLVDAAATPYGCNVYIYKDGRVTCKASPGLPCVGLVAGPKRRGGVVDVRLPVREEAADKWLDFFYRAHGITPPDRDLDDGEAEVDLADIAGGPPVPGEAVRIKFDYLKFDEISVTCTCGRTYRQNVPGGIPDNCTACGEVLS